MCAVHCPLVVAPPRPEGIWPGKSERGEVGKQPHEHIDGDKQPLPLGGRDDSAGGPGDEGEPTQPPPNIACAESENRSDHEDHGGDVSALLRREVVQHRQRDVSATGCSAARACANAYLRLVKTLSRRSADSFDSRPSNGYSSTRITRVSGRTPSCAIASLAPGVSIAAMTASMSATSISTATRVRFVGSTNVRMLLTPRGPKNSSRFGEASQWSVSFTSW